MQDQLLGDPFKIATRAHFNRVVVVATTHPYSGMDFRGDLDLILPVGTQWGAIGKLFDQVFFIF